jgi:hypothetical protein
MDEELSFSPRSGGLIVAQLFKAGGTLARLSTTSASR